MTIAKLFWTGNSQAIRLPKAFRFEGVAVKLIKKGKQVVIEPVVDDWDWIEQLGEPDLSLETAVNELKAEQAQERDWTVFK